MEALSVRRHLVAAVMITLLGLLAATPSTAQNATEAAIPTPTPIPQPTPIPAPDIPTLATADADEARKAVASAAPDARLQDVQQSFPAEQDRIKEIREETARTLKRPGPASMIKEVEKSWGRVRDRLDRWLADLSTRSSALDTTLDDLQTRVSLWRLTRDHGSAAALPEAVRQQIADTVKTLTDAEHQVRSARDSILALQASVGQEKSGADEMLVRLQKEVETRTKGVMGIDSPPLWKAFGGDGERGDARVLFEAIQHERWRSLSSYAAEQGGSLLVWLLMWPALIILMVVMRKKAEVWAQQDLSLKTAVTVLSRPASAALVVTALLHAILQPQAPSVLSHAVGLVMVLAMLRLLPDLLPKPLQLAPFLVVLVFVLWRAVDVVPEGLVVYRLALLALAAGGIAVCAWVSRTLKAQPGTLPAAWQQPAIFASYAALGLFAAGAVADTVGSVDFSTLVLKGTAYAALSVVLWWLVSVTLRSMVRVGLLTAAARRIGVAPGHSDAVRTALFRMIGFAAAAGWALFSLRAFLLLDPLVAGLGRALDWKLTVGDFSIDPGDLLIFGFIIWLSFKIAALVQFILSVDLMPKIDLPRGVPETISRLTRYLVIAVGAVIASAAAGFDISKLTIILGALGVGVGFGLQNIVNNFVSGLILLFERPIRVGDTLELDNTGGVVETIGMRASIVGTWDGAEIIVPNARLISEDVVNWTLNNDRRRMVIPVGVAYGTDPEKAAQLILDAANEHQEVDAEPEPSCLFVDLGDSSLDFQLRAWTAGSAYVRVASDLRFAIVAKLTVAGIEIPFPQRDIHIRTAGPDAAPSGSPEQ